MVVIYTDALTEASDPGGRCSASGGCWRSRASWTRGIPVRVGPALLDGVARHRAGRPADDDVTLLVLHHNAGPTPRLSVGQKLDVYAKVFGLKAV